MGKLTAKQINDRRKRERNARLNKTVLKSSYDYAKMKRDQKAMREIALYKLKIAQEEFRFKETKQKTL